LLISKDNQIKNLKNRIKFLINNIKDEESKKETTEEFEKLRNRILHLEKENNSLIKKI